MNVPATIRKDLPNGNPNDELSLRIRRGDRCDGVNLGNAVDPQPFLIFKVDEQHPDLWILGGIAHREIHPVTVVIRKYQRPLIEYAHESRIASFVGAVRLPGGVRGGEEEHIHALDECAVLVGQLLAKQALLNPVRQSLVSNWRCRRRWLSPNSLDTLSPQVLPRETNLLVG